MPASRSFDMSGSATFTIVMSIVLMNIATPMTPRPHQRLFSTPSCARPDGAKWMKWGASMAAYPAGAR
jgi:hypothetical protein